MGYERKRNQRRYQCLYRAAGRTELLLSELGETRAVGRRKLKNSILNMYILRLIVGLQEEILNKQRDVLV